MKRIVGQYAPLKRALFIIFDENHLERFKKLLESAINTPLFIEKYYNHNCICVPFEKYNEALIAGLQIFESENIPGIWLDNYYNYRGLNWLPISF